MKQSLKCDSVAATEGYFNPVHLTHTSHTDEKIVILSLVYHINFLQCDLHSTSISVLSSLSVP